MVTDVADDDLLTCFVREEVDAPVVILELQMPVEVDPASPAAPEVTTNATPAQKAPDIQGGAPAAAEVPVATAAVETVETVESLAMPEDALPQHDAPSSDEPASRPDEADTPETAE